jgi:hypothetical protein
MSIKDLSSQRFSRILVISREGTNKYRQAMWNCICDCGETLVLSTNHLTTGNTKSCGCYHREKITKHGNYLHPLYSKWIAIKYRCYDKKSGSYPNYGGRGIRMSKSWFYSFEQFAKDIGLPPTPKHSIDRIDNNKGYSKLNCKWSTQKEQNNNTRQTMFLTHEGQTKPVSQWAKDIGIPADRIKSRIRHGKSVSEALSKDKKVNQYR